MTGLGQSLCDLHYLILGRKARGNHPVSGCGGVYRGGAEVSSNRRRSPQVYLRWSLWIGAWNVLSLREDDHPSLRSSELQRLNISIAALSEVRSGEIMADGGYHAPLVAVPVSNKLTPMIIEVTPVNEHFMRLRIHHSLVVISLVSVYAPTEVSDLTP